MSKICWLLWPGLACLGQSVPAENPYHTEADVIRGKQLYKGHCAPCHGPEGSGGKGANLARPKLPRATDDAALFRVVREGLSGTEMPGAWELNDHEVWQVAAFVRTLGNTESTEAVKGDAAHGEKLVRTHCLQCHMVSGEGGTMGPALTEVGLRRTAEFLRKTLDDPSATIPDGFLYLEITTKDNKHIPGIRLAEDTYSIQVRDLAGRAYSFWKSELAEIKRDRTRTPMPSFRTSLSDTERDDLVAYLVSLRGTR